MLKKLSISVLCAVFFACVPFAEHAVAQDASRDISETLSRLKNNPRYKGRVLGTHLRRDGGQFLYEVRILRRRDDRVILVYIDPETGGVVGDSERSAARPSRNKDQRNVDRPKKNRDKRLAKPRRRGGSGGKSGLGIR